MIRGRIRAGREPLIPIVLHGARETRREAILDTGFTGHLCLSERDRRRMKLLGLGSVELELADGRRVRQRAFVGEVTFDGRRVRVAVTTTRSEDSLVGTALLRGKKVVIDFPTGRVSVG